MAKVTAPFFGFHARNQINKALVYFVWKGINAVRTWVVPANPKTVGQVAQRGNFAALVAYWHSGHFTARDIGSWNRAATAVKFKPQSGFNRFVGFYRELYFLGWSLLYLFNAIDASTAANAFTCHMNSSGFSIGDVCQMRWGTKPTSLIYTQNAPYGAPLFTVAAFDTGLTAGATIYWLFEVKGAPISDWGKSGINKSVLT